MTRGSLKSEEKQEQSPRKKVAFLVRGTTGNNKNNSIASDEGIDVSEAPPTPVSRIPTKILRPQHKLSQPWTMWYSAGNKNLSWKKNQVPLATLDTVEQFWQIYNQVKLASELRDGHTYSVFKAGIMPDWEDPENSEGGRWLACLDKKERKAGLDDKWLELLLLLFGGKLDSEDGEDGLVNGVEVCVRRQKDRLETWLATTDMRRVAEVGRRLKTQLGCTTLQFSIHGEEKEGMAGLSRLTI